MTAEEVDQELEELKKVATNMLQAAMVLDVDHLLIVIPKIPCTISCRRLEVRDAPDNPNQVVEQWEIKPTIMQLVRPQAPGEQTG